MWGYRTDKSEKVGEFDCAVWKMDGVEFRTRVRTEHLKDEDGKPIVPLKKGAAPGGGRGGHAHNSSRRIRGVGRHGAVSSNRDGRDKKSIVFQLGTGMGSSSSLDEKRGPREIQPRRPRPLFAPFTEPDTTLVDSELTSTTTAMEGMQLRSDSPETMESENTPEQSMEKLVEGTTTGTNGVVLKKHARSTGTISDDAFFETALDEMEEELEEKLAFRASLPPPPPTTMTFDEYFDPSKAGEIHLGRPLEQKESLRSFGATLWMYENPTTATTATTGTETTIATAPHFPLTIDKILPLLEVIGMDNNRLVSKLKEFLQFKLPPGFPIRANIPVYASISADVTFVNYDAKREMEADLFDVPGEEEGYQEGYVIRPGGDDDT